MTNITKQILAVTSNIAFADGQKLNSLMSEIIIRDNNIGFSINVDNQNLKEVEIIRQQVIKDLKDVVKSYKLTITLTASNEKLRHIQQKPKIKHFINNVRKIITVAAGKGGVGKSTITALIAEKLILDGYKAGIVDADIYGPSIPKIFNVKGNPEIIDKRMVPKVSRGVEIMSIGFLTAGNEAVAWRGPMASKAIYQLLSATDWNDLDYLIIDMPPGTGDIHLAILENYHIDGVVMVTTPQQISRIDVEKAINLYRKFDIPILGIVENMSYFLDNNGNKIEIFTGGSGQLIAAEHEIPFICKIPLISSLSQACDDGTILAEITKIPIEQFLPINS